MPQLPVIIDHRAGEGGLRASAASGLFVAVVIIGTLYFGQDVFVPAALAILLSFVLAPLVRFLQRCAVPRGIAVLAVVLMAFMMIVGIGTMMVSQVSQLATDLPRYQTTMQEKIRSFRGATEGNGVLDRVSDVVQNLSRELNRTPPAADAGTAVGTTAAEPADRAPTVPIPVVVQQAETGPLATMALVIDPLLHPLATTGIIIIFVIFILLQREDLRNRLIRLAGAHDIQNTTAAMDDAGRRLSRLFLTQVALNSAFGIVIGLGLWAIGVPSPILWGVLAAVLRFVPYIGPVIAAALPIILAAAVDSGWSMVVWTAVLFAVVEPIVGHGIEPMVYGRSTGLSPVAVVVAATFWTWLWGPIGLLLATPITVCLVVLGRHVKTLEFLDIMFGDRPALTPSELFYQRILAGDPLEATEKAIAYLKERSLTSYYDEVALKGLELAQKDHARGALDDERIARINASLDELIDDLLEHEDKPKTPPVTNDPEAQAALDSADDDDHPATLPVLQPAELLPTWQSEAPVLIISGRGPLDDAAARILGQILLKHGLKSRVLGWDALSTANLFRLDSAGVAMVCFSYLDPASLIPARTGVKRVQRKIPAARTLVGLWRSQEDEDQMSPPVEVLADHYASTFEDALRICLAEAVGSGSAEKPTEGRARSDAQQRIA